MIIQFLSENIILCFLALTASIFFGQILLAEYNKMWPDINFVMNLSKDYDFWIFLIGLLIFTALFAGAYPAFYISKFDPIPILKGASKFSGTNLFTRILLVIQFTIALVGLISAVIFTQNAKFQETKYLGYNKDEVIVAYTEESRLKPFIDRISQNPQIKTIAETQHHIGWGWYKRTIEYKNEQIETGGYRVGKNYFETLGVLLLEGRFFEERFKSTDEKNSIVVTKKFIDDLGIENPIGERVRMEDTLDLTIVGVIDDFYPYGMWMKVNPVMFRRGNDEHMHTIAVQTDKENVYAINDYMKSEWEKMYPDNPYDGMVQVELMNESKDINKSILKIFIFLALISLLISLIGLYTLISLTVIKKTQEIGIRKVLGSPIHRLIILLNKEFLIIMAFASVFGSISGYYLSEMLLSSIWEVYIDSNAISIIVPVVLLFIISLTTISGKVYYAAIKNPVDAIRYE